MTIVKTIMRAKYLNRIIELNGTPDIKIITGIRRSGKSKLMQAYIEYLRSHFENINIIFILANIYLNELDTFVEKLKLEYDRQDSYRKPQKEYSQTLALAHYWEKKRKTAVEQGDEAEVQRAKGRVNELYAKLLSIPCFPAIDPTFKKIQYVRYADDFIIGVIGPKADAEIIKGKLRAFLHDELNLTLSEEKTKITHSAELVRFLGYDLTVSRSQDYSRDKNGNLKRHWNGQVKCRGRAVLS